MVPVAVLIAEVWWWFKTHCTLIKDIGTQPGWSDKLLSIRLKHTKALIHRSRDCIGLFELQECTRPLGLLVSSAVQVLFPCGGYQNLVCLWILQLLFHECQNASHSWPWLSASWAFHPCPAMNLWKFLAAAAVLLALDAFDIRSCTMTPNLKAASALKVHLYDHCPYCTRVELVLGWHRRRYARKVYGYADVTGPTALTGKKVLPVITWRDEANMEHTLGESKDIIEAWNRHRSKFKLLSIICICIYTHRLLDSFQFQRVSHQSTYSRCWSQNCCLTNSVKKRPICRYRNITQPRHFFSSGIC